MYLVFVKAFAVEFSQTKCTKTEKINTFCRSFVEFKNCRRFFSHSWEKIYVVLTFSSSLNYLVCLKTKVVTR